MKRQDTRHSWNWVDHNNRMVGFENEIGCCENFGYFWMDSGFNTLQDDLCDDESLFFTGKHESSDNNYDCGGGHRFEVSDPNGTIYFLEIFNNHNGFYSHGFDFHENDKLIIGSSL